MTISRRTVLKVSASALGAVAMPGIVRAQQDFPNKPIRLIVPFAPGAGNDVMARFTAQEISPRLGTIVVENKPGAGSQTGIDYVVHEKPDGYTWVWVASDGISILPAVKASVPYKIPDDLSWIAGITTFPMVAMVNPALPINNMADLVSYAKANPGKVRYGTSGVGSAPHLIAALIANTTGIKMVHVPYQGLAPAVTGMMGGFVDIVIGAPSSALPIVEAGKVRAFAVTGPKRHPLFPNTQTVVEAGWPTTETQLIFGACAPPGVPEPIMARIRKEFETMCKDPKAIEGLRKIGYDAEYYGGDRFKDFVVKDLARWKKVAQESNIAITD